MFTLRIDTDNAGFDPDPSHEVARLLEQAARKVRDGQPEGPLLDVNGNTVGHYG